DGIGGIPSDGWATSIMPGLHPGGQIDDGPAINSAIAAAAPNTVLIIPAGTYRISHHINMKSNVVLRGAKPQGFPPYLPTADATATTLVLDSDSYLIFFRGGDKNSNWTPGAQSGYSITSGYTQGSTNLTLSS